MDVLGADSLFSLELFVEKLSLCNVTCRFPALAFRLLDFPTLIIYHVEPNLAETIRTKVNADPHYKLPPQIPELQDRHGDFIMKKGKSCLFKSSAESLNDHLSSAPLYVMLIDTYPDVPKLLGSFGVSLDACMSSIVSDIERMGIATPSTHGEKGEHLIFSMMGTQIGSATMGFRLLSLGQGLLAHIPENALMKSSVSLNTKSKMERKKTKTDITQSIQALDKDIQVSMSSPRFPVTENQTVQTVQQAESETQTDKTKQKKNKVNYKMKPTELDDVFVTNIVCPPPLFYNSTAAEPEIEHYAHGLTLTDDLTAVRKDKNDFSVTGKISDNDTDVSSEEDTIRQEDKLDASDTEEVVDFKNSKVYKTQESHYPPLSRHTFHQTIVRGGGTSISRKQELLPTTANLQGLPLLNALLKEMLVLQDMHAQQGSGHASTNVKRHAMQKDLLAWENNEKPLDYHIVLAEKHKSPASPSRHVRMADVPLTPGRHSHRSCTSDAPAVPKNKSWLRSEQPLGIKKSKLTYGLTNTQRLRLAKANPDLLKTLEQQEEIRLQNRKKGGKSEKPARKEEEQKKQEKEQKKQEKVIQEEPDKPVPLIPVGDSMDTTAGMSTLHSTSDRPHRPPKPTPRLSKQLTRDTIKALEGLTAYNDVNSPIQADSLTEVQFEHSKSPVSHTQSIEIHVPSANDDDSYEDEGDATSEASSYHSASQNSQLGRTKTLTRNTGIGTRDTMESRISMNSVAYSDDFELPPAAVSAADLGFKNMAEVYSDEEESEYAEEPVLRKEVDRYSDKEVKGREPELRKVMDTYIENSAPAMGEEPILRKVVDRFSDSDSDSFASANNKFSPDEQDKPVAAVSLSHKNRPITSENSPINASLKATELGTTRTPLDVTSSHDIAIKESFNSTAYISRSQILSETATSQESTGEWKHHAPRRSPPRKIDKVSSIHTDSVSSYAPSDSEVVSPLAARSDSEIVSPLPAESYSEAFEDSDMHDSLLNQNPNKIKLSKQAKLGYTWS